MECNVPGRRFLEHWSTRAEHYRLTSGRLLKECGGWDSNPRTPARLDPESSAFDLTWQPPHHGIRYASSSRTLKRGLRFLSGIIALCHLPLWDLLKGHAVQTSQIHATYQEQWQAKVTSSGVSLPDSEVDSRSKNKRITHNWSWARITERAFQESVCSSIMPKGACV